jgi:O-antigen/teichoic acid export membrane protein
LKNVLHDRLVTGAPDPSGLSHRSVRNSVFNTLINGTSAVSYMVLFIALARGLQPAAMGEYYTLFAVVLIVQLVFEMGIPTVMTGRISRVPSEFRGIVTEATALQAFSVGGQFIAFLCMGTLAAWHSGDTGTLLRFLLGGCAAAGIQVQRFCAGIFRADELFIYENVMRLGQGLGLAVTVVALISFGVTNLTLMIAVLAASHALGALFLVVNVQNRYHCLTWRAGLGGVKGWLAEALPLGVTDSIRGQGWQLDTVLLGILQPASVVGLYNAAYRPLSVLYWLPTAASAATFPTLVQLARRPDLFNRAVANSVRILWIVSLPVAVIISVGAEHFIALLAGHEYVDAALPMRLLVWKILFASLAIQYRFVFAAIGKLSTLARIALFATALDVATELVLIPFWGYFGACSGTLLGELVFTLLTLSVCKQLGIRCADWGPITRAALAGCVMGALLCSARQVALPAFLIAAAAATGVYLLVCLLAGALGWDELGSFYEALRHKRTILPKSSGIAPASNAQPPSSSSEVNR